MKSALVLLVLALPAAAFAEEIFLSCQVTQIAASEKEGRTDAKLKKIAKFLEKDSATQKYQSFRYVGKRSLNATKSSSGTAKLKNGDKLSVRVVSVHRAQKKNTVTIDLTVGGSSVQKSFVDRDYLILSAGTLDKKSDLVVALHCPVFP
ncbi:MAG: hypothetical protein ACOY5B_03290 [Spirochaetota bacterium]